MAGDWRTTAAKQGGVISRAQLRRLGVSERRLGTLTVPRELIRVRHGVYADGALSAGATAAQRTALAVAAERLLSGTDLIAVGRTAARIHSLAVLGGPSRLQVVERKQVRPTHHGGSRLVIEADVEQVLGVPVTDLARTAVDVARTGFAAGVVTADAALRAGADRRAMELAVDLSRRWPGRLTAEAAVAFADAQAETALESLGRARLHEQGLPPPELQVWIDDGGPPFARVDQCWPGQRTVAEADGALKYGEAGSLFAEKLREDRLREAGWEVVRYTWDEALRRPELIAARVRRAFQRAHRRAA